MKADSGTKVLPWSGYADDIILFLIDRHGLETATDLLNQTFQQFGLRINLVKTETMVANHSSLGNEPYPETLMTLDDIPLTNTEQFKYLGSQVHQNQPNTGDAEIDHRIESARIGFMNHAQLLKNHDIKLPTRMIFLRSFVRSRLTYSCQNWNPTQGQFDRLDVAYRGFLRRMIRDGYKTRQSVDSTEPNQHKLYITNERMHEICRSSDVSDFIRTQQEYYLCHVIRAGSELATNQLLFNADKYTKRGRPTPTLLQQVCTTRDCTNDDIFEIALRDR